MIQFAHIGLLSSLVFVLAGAQAWSADTAQAPTTMSAVLPQPQNSNSVPAPAPPSQPETAPAATNAGSPTPSYPSIMFWPDEVESIEKAIEDHEHPPAAETAAKNRAEGIVAAAAEAEKPHPPNVYVSAILDFGGGDWTVWANGMRVTPQHQPPLFHITAVQGNSVDIVVPGDGGGHFRLQPYQTWRSRQGDVVEGIFP